QEDIHQIGCLAKVVNPRAWPDGTLQANVEGLVRARISSMADTGDLLMVNLEKVRETAGVGVATSFRTAKKLLEQYAKQKSTFSERAAKALLEEENPSSFVDKLAAGLFNSVEEKQIHLETTGVKNRLDLVIAKIESEIDIHEIDKTVRGRVKKQMEKSQRDYYLTEQMKAIQKELGRQGGEKSELEELAARINKAGMPTDVQEKAHKELGRLEQMPPQSAEGTVVRNYLDWLLDVPWDKKTEDKMNIAQAERILNEDHFGLDEVKERILEYLAVRTLVEKTKGPILCFVGPPGVGKTSLGRSIARAMGRKFVRFSLGGVRDEAEIRGHRRTYIGSLPGKIIQGMKKAGAKNPVMMLDEIDKLSSDFRGDPSSALLEALDPEQNRAFNDHYLEVDYDLSDVMFVTTANVLGAIPKPLRDRMEVISIPGYNDEDKIRIAEDFLIPRQTKDHGLTTREINFPRKSLAEIIRHYTRESGVRGLERSLAKVCRKVARTVAQQRQASVGKKKSAKPKKVTLIKGRISEYLGQSKHREEMAEKRSGAGLVTALAWTETGGVLLKIETIILEGKGKFILTGKLGDVMKESAQAALSYIRSRAVEFGLAPGFYSKIDIHIHIPEGAIPKDGPSAGVAICVSMLSALQKIPVRHDVAMTGEITLRGNVIMIGGLREKLLAAQRAGIKTVLIPKENERELLDAPDGVKSKLRIIPVEHMDQALTPAMEKSPFKGAAPAGRKTGVANEGRAAVN
ncbi:MAG: endopeptidase La, partial [Nitrospinota bacterium]|nr:endopeptidase La [Nitrospinota bacterium]